MAIPEGRMSTQVVSGNYLPVKDRAFYPLAPYEMGPIAIEDTTEGLLYQAWSGTYNSITGDITLTPERTGLPVVVLTVLGVTFFSFTFDSAGHVTIAYQIGDTAYLYWYDTALGSTTTDNLGTSIITPTVVLDDKRQTQNAKNDILLWYTKPFAGLFNLYMGVQRERFLTEHTMATGLSAGQIRKAGMSDETRLQLTLNSAVSLESPEALSPGDALNLLIAAAAGGLLNLNVLPTLPFDTIFGVSVDGADFSTVVNAGYICLIEPSADITLTIEDSIDCSEAILIIGFGSGVARGFINGSLHYINVPIGATLPLAAGQFYFIAFASDTGQVKITKATV